MAFVSTNSQIKNNILNYISRLVSKTLYRAIEILFKPCCDISITNVSAVCSATPNAYDVTVTLSKSKNLLGKGLMLVIVNDRISYVNSNQLIPYNDSKTFTIEGLNIGSTTGGTFGVSIVFLLPVSESNNPTISDLTPGAFIFTNSELDFTFPACS